MILKVINNNLLTSTSFIVLSRMINRIMLPDITMELKLYSTMHELKNAWTPLKEAITHSNRGVK
jgi:hypothetical protein